MSHPSRVSELINKRELSPPLIAGIIIGCKPAKSDVEERVKRRERKAGAPLVAG